MDVVKSATWYAELLERSLGIYLNLGQLASDTCLAHIPICFYKLFHMNLLAINFRVVCMEGCARPWIESNTWHLQLAGTIGCAFPVDVPHNSVTSSVPKETSFTHSLEAVVQ